MLNNVLVISQAPYLICSAKVLLKEILAFVLARLIDFDVLNVAFFYME